ncbi:hypothetical protein OS493_039836 [Desmophyllum pertusum]|uniref:Uncharacterized protein n=1 Tax=Desmophyllum pertusum TaxID=174260 RepID=A0A9W9Y9M8_9CNID|nr:hypothetical protein OS493_039836 [Desmophyllum pertusum]
MCKMEEWIKCTVLQAAVAAHGKYEAQDVLAQAVKTGTRRPLTNEEYETLLISIFYLPDGPLHSSLFTALLELTIRGWKRRGCYRYSDAGLGCPYRKRRRELGYI